MLFWNYIPVFLHKYSVFAPDGRKQTASQVSKTADFRADRKQNNLKQHCTIRTRIMSLPRYFSIFSSSSVWQLHPYRSPIILDEYSGYYRFYWLSLERLTDLSTVSYLFTLLIQVHESTLHLMLRERKRFTFCLHWTEWLYSNFGPGIKKSYKRYRTEKRYLQNSI